MIGQSIRTAVAPYLIAIKAAAVVAVFAVGFERGCSVQKGRDADLIGKKNAQLLEDATALRKVAAVLKASSSVLRTIDAQARANLAKAQREAADLAKAGQVAEQAWKDAEARASRLAKELKTARERKPECDALLRGDLEKTCAYKPR